VEINKMNIEKEFWKLYKLLLTDKLKKSDVVIWLQGDRYDRVKNILKIYRSNLARYILISGNNILIGSDKRIGENNISLLEMYNYLIRNAIKKDKIIVDDNALNTKDQAVHIMKIAKFNNWKRIILVSSAYNQPRTFLTFLKQAQKTKWKGKIINQPSIIAWNKKPAGRDKTAKTIFNQEFEKIKKYKKDLVSIGQGIKYIKRKNA
jgi:uncharacterized SAM-binding protein YcdF (DUF218 family)